MKVSQGAALALFIIPFALFADTQSIYCPQNHAYINIGMRTDEVIAACGQPQIQQESKQPLMQKIPLQQLIYNNKGTSTTGFGVWGINTGNSGVQLEIDLVDNKVDNIKLNDSDSNAMSICGGSSIQIGDLAEKVYNSCGSPSIINNTYINQVIRSAEKPKIWIYNPGQYQPSITLTFVDGRLQSIN